MTIETRRLGIRLAIFVIAAALAARGARAQTADSTAPRTGRQLVPGGDGQRRILEHVRSTPASTIERGLPGITLDDYLFASLASLVEAQRPQFASWGLTPCEDLESAVPGVGNDLCAEVLVPISADRRAHVMIAGATFVTAAGSPTGRWLLIQPRLRDVHIDRLDGTNEVDSLDVASLADVAASLRVPFEEWPTVDLVPTIRWTPAAPAPGQTIRFTFEVRNDGKRAINRVRASALVGGCCVKGGEWRRDWFPHLRPGQSAAFEASVETASPVVTAVLSVGPFRGLKIVRESNDANNTFVAAVGDPRQPPR